MSGNLVYHFISGTAYFHGIALLFIACGLSSYTRRLPRMLTHLLAAAGAVLITLSATPAPRWLIVAWALLGAAWLIAYDVKRLSRGRAPHVLSGGVAGLCILAAALELSYHSVKPPETASTNAMLYVVGDSISAGISGSADNRWPELLAARHGVTVVNLAVAGAHTDNALEQAERIPPGAAFVIVEIGGNDLLAGTPSDLFERDLAAMLEQLHRPDRTLVMCELPLPPLQADYGRVQRQLAHRFGATLIPKRVLARVLSRPDATVDGVHLSEAGHALMANAVWNVIGPAFAGQ